MKKVSCACLVAAALSGAHLTLTAAEAARLRYLASVYADANGGGLNLPEGVACNGSGQVVVGDTGNNRLLRFTYVDKSVSGGTEVKIPQLSAPARVQLNSKGEIYALDSVQRRIAHLGPEGEFKETLAFEGAPNAASIVPKSFVIDPADHIYVLDVFGGRVLVLNPQGQFQKALDLPGDVGFASEVAVDASGSVLVLDSIKRRILSAAKDATTFAPMGGDLTQFVATLPSYFTTIKGAILVVEGNGGTIVALGRDGAFLSRQLTPGWNEGQLNHPSQICVNGKDEAFVADRDNSRVQVFQIVR